MWVIIDGKEHIKVKTFEEGVKLLENKLESSTSVKLLAEEEYVKFKGRIRKRGKKSLKK